MSKEMSNAEFDSAMSAIPGVTRVEMTRTAAMGTAVNNNLSAKADAEVRYLELCKHELSLKLALKTIQETKKETEKELAELDAIGQVKFEW